MLLCTPCIGTVLRKGYSSVDEKVKLSKIVWLRAVKKNTKKTHVCGVTQCVCGTWHVCVHVCVVCVVWPCVCVIDSARVCVIDSARACACACVCVRTACVWYVYVCVRVCVCV